MTKVNDYMWQLPHSPLADDPPDVNLLQQNFNSPIVGTLQEALGRLGYELKTTDVMVKLQDRQDRTMDTYFANVRFIKYLSVDVLARIHFEHSEWAHFLPQAKTHQYSINLDRFKMSDPVTQQLLPGWDGRLHTRMSNRDADVLEHNGPDQIWAYTSAQQLERQLQLFLDKFIRFGVDWLENPSTL
jgi:hypothetical protein